MAGEQELPDEASVVIVGGGVVGCSIAYHFGLKGQSDVLLLERRELTCGTTWHAAGLVGQLRATANLTRLAQYTTELYATLERETGQATGFRQNGAVNCAVTEGRWEELKRGAAMARSYGLECELLRPETVHERWPLLAGDDLQGAVFLPSDGQTNPIDTARAMAAGARRNGVAIRENTAVRRILHGDGRVAGVETDAGTVRARQVVLCAGMWSRELARACGVAVPLHAAEHFYVVTEPMPGLPRDFPVVRDADHCIYIKEDAGKLLIGAFEPVAKPWGGEGIPADFCFDELPFDQEHFEPFLLNAMTRVPALENVGIQTWFCGPESFTPDDRYLLGPVPELEGLFVATGFNSIGIQSAGGAGKVLADWLETGRPPMELWDVDVRRVVPFQSNRRYLRDRTVETLGLLYALHWPHRQPETARGARRSALHDRLAAAGACFGELAGWERANWYARDGQQPVYRYSFGRQNWFDCAAAEHRAVRESVGLFDQSSFGKILLQGRDAEAVLNRICTADVAVPVGRVVYAQWLNGHGGIEADLTVTRTGRESFLIVTGAGTLRRDLDWLRRHTAKDVNAIATDVTSAYAVLGVMGPESRALLSALSDDDLANEAFPFGTSREIDLAYARVRATRITYVGELGWELYMPTEFVQGVYDALVQEGARHGLAHAGYHAMDSLRLEKAYRHWGHDIGEEDTPLEAGLGFTVAWDKPGGFIGREALLGQRERGVTRRLAVFVVRDPSVMLFHDEPVWRDGGRVGRITSGGWGHTVGAAIGLGYLPVPEGDAGAATTGSVEIEVGDRMVPAEVSLRPLYDPTGARVRS